MLDNEKGQILPFVAFMLVIVLWFAAFTISTTMMFLERKKVEDALDTAVLSASLTDVQSRMVATYYGDGLSFHGLSGHNESYSYTDSDGNEHSGSYWVWDDWEWHVVESQSYHRNCIHFTDTGQCDKYFKKNLMANSSKAEIEGLSIDVEYDDERFLKVVKNRIYMIPPGTDSDGKSIVGRSSNPTWWHRDYGGTVGYLNQPPSFNVTNETEERIVRFPRWVKINATAKVRVPSLMGSILGGGNTTLVTVHAESIRELSRVDKPFYGWQDDGW